MQNSGDLVSAGGAQKTSPPPEAPREKRIIEWRPIIVLAALTAVLALCFINPLYKWVGFVIDSEFYSYMPLMPAITGYLIWLRSAGLGANLRPSWGGTAVAAAAGGGILALYFLALQNGWIPGEQDYLCVMTLSFLLLLGAAGFATLGAATMSAIAFPLAMLLFMVPYPEALNNGMETFFQNTSAITANGFYHLAGTRCDQDGLILHLKGSPTFSAREITNLPVIVNRLRTQSDPVSAFVWKEMTKEDQAKLMGYQASSQSPEQFQTIVVQAFNKTIGDPSLFTPERLQSVVMRPDTANFLMQDSKDRDRAMDNRLLLDAAFRQEVSGCEFSLTVAPECSGIHSTQVLLITSLLAGNLFLRSTGRRLFLAVFIVPLAIVRNGFRIFVIGELCLHVGHHMIDSPIHHHGGPIFFALSLIPFFLLLIWLRKSESKTQSSVKIGGKT